MDQAKGNFDGLRQAYTIGANDQILSSDGYKPIIMAYKNGAPVGCRMSPKSLTAPENPPGGLVNDTPAVILNIQRQPGANIIGVVDRIKALLPQLKVSIPPRYRSPCLPTVPPRSALRCRTCNSN